MCMYLNWHVKTDIKKKRMLVLKGQHHNELPVLFSFYIYCYCINLVPFLFISLMLSTFPFPLKPHSELLVDCYYPVLYQLMEPT